MKTTFKTVFNELDDELMDIDVSAPEVADIDVDKIKGEVFMRIHDTENINGSKNKTEKKKFSKKLIAILIAAALVVGGTAGAFATGSIQQIFGNHLKGSAELNDLGLYDGGNVEVKTDDDNLDVKLLGVMSDGEVAYSALAVTHKDGSPIVDEGLYVNQGCDPLNSFEFSCNGEKSESVNALAGSYYKLSDDRKSLMIYTDYMKSEHDLTDLRVTYNNTNVHGYTIDKILYSEEIPETLSGDEMTDEELYQYDLMIEKLEEENGLTEDDCISVEHDGKRVYAKGEFKKIDLDFTISFDFNKSVNNLIERDISNKTMPNVVRDYTRNSKIIISPLGITLAGECDNSIAESIRDGAERCFDYPENDGNSKLVMDDGMVYYILINEGGEHSADDNGVFHEKTHLQYSYKPAFPFNPGDNRIIIDLDKVQTVIINGDTIYQK